MGGIQVDADDMLKKLRSRKEGAESSTRTPKAGADKAITTTLDDMKAENEKLNLFFEELKKKAAGESPKGTTGKREVSRDAGDTPSKKAATRD